MTLTDSPSSWRLNLLLLFLLLVPAAAIYLAYIDNPWFFDDETLVGWVQEGRRALQLQPREVALAFTLLNLLPGDDPLVSLRFGNLVAHLGCVLLVWVFSRLLLRVAEPVRAGSRGQEMVAFGAALLFALHPVAAYATGYAIQRTILLATFFSLACAICHLRAQHSGGAWHFAAAVLCYGLAVFSKEHAIMLPAVMGTLSYWLHCNGFPWRNRWLPVFAGYLLFAVAILWLRARGIQMGALYEPLAQLYGFQPAHPHLTSIATQALLFFGYLGLWVIPDPRWMSIDVQVDLPGYVLPWWGLLGVAAFLGLLLLSLRAIRRPGAAGLLAFVSLWALLLFATELWAVRISETFVLYRSYLWMPLVPLVLLLGVRRLVGGPRRHRVLMLAIGSLAIGAALVLQERLASMSTPVALWQDAVAKNAGVSWPGVARSYSNLGAARAMAGEIEAARSLFETAIRYNVGAYGAYCNLANYHRLRGDLDNARYMLVRAAAIAPDAACVAQMRRLGVPLKLRSGGGASND